MVPDRTQLFAAYLLSATVVLVAAGGSLLYMETASVKLSVPSQRLEAYITLAGPQAQGGLQTQRIQADVTESQQGTASPVQISGTYATGQVVFICSPACAKAPLTIPTGTLVSTTNSLGYATEAAATITSTDGSVPAVVRATAPGSAWNAAPGTITLVANPANLPDPNIKVSNPTPIAGGADARTTQVIQQSDFDMVRNALTIKVNNELGAALNTNSQGRFYNGDPQPVITITSDHSVGDETPTFTIKMTGTIGATTYAESQAKAIMQAALQAKVPPGEELTNAPVQIIYQSHQDAPNTDVYLTGKADGFVIPKLSPQSLRSQIRGLTPAQAAKSLQRKAPMGLVEIRISPSVMPWLPLIADHISLTVVVEPGRY